MYVIRFTYPVKIGRRNDLIELFKSMPEYGLPSPPHGWRIYRDTHLSPYNEVTNEMEFESMTEFEAWWEECWAAPRAREVFDKMMETVERGGGGELRRVEVLK